MRVGAYLVVPAIAIAACTRILGIDGRYVLEEQRTDSGRVPIIGSGGLLDDGSGSGGQDFGGAGGENGAGGILAAGGMPMGAGGAGGTDLGSGGSTGGTETGGSGGMTTDAQVPCDSGKKRCGGICVVPDPSVGCGATGCDRCPDSPPNGGYLVCTNDQCDFACSTGYTKDATNGVCNPPATGAGGAGGGPGGIGAKCTKPTITSSSECAKCGPFPGCCNVTFHCGCLYAVACI